MKSSHKILVDFKEAVENGSFQGDDARAIALGEDFLGRMIEQSRMQIEWAKREEKEVIRRSKEAIQQVGGQVNGEQAAASIPHQVV